jgi:hypothetical protein
LITISWPAPETNYVLEATESLTAPQWVAISNAPTVVNSRLTVTNSVTGPSRFYRLRQQ